VKLQDDRVSLVDVHLSIVSYVYDHLIKKKWMLFVWLLIFI